jgi:hypothetical protein
VRPDERDAILREDAPRAQTALERRQARELDEDLRSSPLRSRPLPLRLRNFRPSPEGYLAAGGGPRPYMLRLREIEALTEGHELALEAARARLASELDSDRFAQAWLEVVERWSFDEVNDLIERHNRWYPVESRLPMDPRRRDYALVNGRDYRLRRLDARWALERFPPPSDGHAGVSRVVSLNEATSVRAHRIPQST